MTRLNKRVSRLADRVTGPVLRPLGRRVEAWFFARVEPRMKGLASEVAPGLHALLRELDRLQHRVDELEAALAGRKALETDSDRAKAG